MGYFDAQEGAHARTAFRTAEKLYKRYKTPSTNSRKSKFGKKTLPPTDLSQVLDFNKYAEVLKDRTSKVDGVSLATGASLEAPVFVIDGHPGFYFIPQALSAEEQFYWIRESLTSFPQPPNRTNHSTVYGPISDLWFHVQEKHGLVEDTANDQEGNANGLIYEEFPDTSADRTTDERHNVIATGPLEVTATGSPCPVEQFNCKEKMQTLLGDSHVGPPGTSNKALTPRIVHEKPLEGSSNWRFVDEAGGINSSDTKATKISAESLLRKLRWATIGQQFDWSKKCYNTMLPYKKLPLELSELAGRLAEPAMKGEKFLAEGAIVNYYGPDDMLGGHIDDMEADWSKPIVSISLGCKAVFLLGGTSRDETPVAMFLRSGDVVLMAGPARRCFHGIPRIFVEPCESELPDFSAVDEVGAGFFLDYIKESRININVSSWTTM